MMLQPAVYFEEHAKTNLEILVSNPVPEGSQLASYPTTAGGLTEQFFYSTNEDACYNTTCVYASRQL